MPSEDSPIGQANRTRIVDEVKFANEKVKNFRIAEFQKILNSKYNEDLLSLHLKPNSVDERFPIIYEKIQSILNL